jgi:hypothetical protein
MAFAFISQDDSIYVYHASGCSSSWAGSWLRHWRMDYPIMEENGALFVF